MVERNADELTWLKYDLDAIEQCEPTIVARNSDSMVFSGKFDPWGYIAMAVPPGLLRKPGLLRVRVRVNIRKGTVGLGVLTPDERDFYKQTKVTAPGAHVIALETDCSSGPGPIVLRHGQAAAGETEFELEVVGASSSCNGGLASVFASRYAPDFRKVSTLEWCDSAR